MYQNRDYTSEITRLVETKTIENEKETKNKNKKKEQIDFQNYDKILGKLYHTGKCLFLLYIFKFHPWLRHA